LRFWELHYDRQLTQWLKPLDPSKPSIMAAREFGGEPRQWQFDRADLLAKGWLEPLDLAWQPDPQLNPRGNPAATPADWLAWSNAKNHAFKSIRGEIEQLQMLMQDDRDRYLAEIIEQADGLADYIIAFIDANQARYPWTIELINCGLAIGNIAYFYYKQHFKRVRPSTLCPGLAPPFGPPMHPSFTSGHSFLGHLIALLLLEVPALRQRYGMFVRPFNGTPGRAVDPYPTVTISQANPAVVTLSVLRAHGLKPGDQIQFQQIPPALAVTISETNPAVVTVNGPTAHGLNAGDRVQFQQIPGSSPPPLPAPIGPPPATYYVLPAGLTANAFEFSATSGGTPVDTSAGGGSPVPAIILPNPPPAPIVVGTTYYVLLVGLTANSFEFSATSPGAPISTAGTGGSPVPAVLLKNPLMGRGELRSPLLWLGERIAKNRERLGVHYPSDSSGSRHIAAGIWRALLHDRSKSRIDCPTLHTVLGHAKAEWRTRWP
jgi:hypothetical protein